jgi:TrmH family RNA methyltransferase
MKQINSIQNPFIKNLFKLQEKARERKNQGLFLIEGKREIELALKGNYEITSLLFLANKINENFLADFPAAELIEISQEIYHKLAYRSSTEGIIAIAKTKSLALSEITIPKNSLILVAEGIEKPGNIGAILRTADAANIDAVLIADAKSDLYNPNIIRSSVGCVFTNQIAIGTSEEIIAFIVAIAIVIGFVASTYMEIKNTIAEEKAKVAEKQENEEKIKTLITYFDTKKKLIDTVVQANKKKDAEINKPNK